MKSRKQDLILFMLGVWYLEANKQIRNKNLEISISKSVFIDLVKKAQLATKKERAMYKNLENLEKKKFISYKNRNLALTDKGLKFFNRLNKEISPYLSIISIISAKNPLSYTKKAQTVFKK
jgi:DNA-binding PadR family transcriptional regulator